MNPDFKPLAVEFVRAKNCAQHTPVELIKEAMEIGASEALKFSLEITKKANLELKIKRAKN